MIIEGIILYFLVGMIMSALLASDYSMDAIAGNSYPAGMAIIYVVILTAAVGIAIFFYIRLAILPAVQERKRKKAAAAAAAASPPSRAAQPDGAQPEGAANIAAANANPAYNPGLKVTGIMPVRRKKSKKPLFIFIIILLLLIGAAAYLFIARPAWLPFELPAIPFFN